MPLPGYRDTPDWATLQTKVTPITVHGDRMEDVPHAAAMLDFANRDLMIHEVIPSATQEEILFSTRPELFISMLFIPRLRAHEAAVFRNARMIVEYTGYQSTFTVTQVTSVEPSLLPTPADERPSTCNDIIAIDAIVNSACKQFMPRHIHRDINKALAGFQGCFATTLTRNDGQPPKDNLPILSTGLWGCGVFGGDPVLKMLQQLMVASHLGVVLHFSTYKQPSVQATLSQIAALISQCPDFCIGDIYKLMTAASPSALSRGTNFPDYVLHTLRTRIGLESDFDEQRFHVCEKEKTMTSLLIEADNAERVGDSKSALALYRKARALDPTLFEEIYRRW
eukprot:m.242890 g.242890  ORF g.242890 m.242890 type:complete len:338 (-) comp17139_c0_seq4:2856-3869(-)